MTLEFSRQIFEKIPR